MPPWGNDRDRAGDEGLDSGLRTYMPWWECLQEGGHL